MKLFLMSLPVVALIALIPLAGLGYPDCHVAWYVNALLQPLAFTTLFTSLIFACVSFYFYVEKEEELHEAWRFRSFVSLVVFVTSMFIGGMMPDSTYCGHIWRAAYDVPDAPTCEGSS